MFVRWQIARRDVLSRLSDDKSSPETFWAVCQMTNRPQRRFEPFVRWQIVPRDVLSRLSDDKSSPETFWNERPLHFKKNDDLRASPSWSFCLKGYFYGLPRWRSQWRVWGHWIATLRSQWRVWGHWIVTLTLAMTGMRSLDCHASLAMTGMRSLDCHADARDDGLGTWVYKSFFTKIVSGGDLSKVFPRARG